MCKRVLSICIAFLCLIGIPFCAHSAEKSTLSDVKSAVEGVVSYKMREQGADSVGSLFTALSDDAGNYYADWYYIALNRFGYDIHDKRSVSALKKAVNGFYSEGLESVKVTDLQRTALALLACGEDITDVDGHNLLADASYNRPKYRPLNAQGVNSLSYALILLDAMQYRVPDSASETRESIIESILRYEADNVGFDLAGSGYADTDITAITIQALAPYKDRSDVAPVVDRALAVLSKRMDEQGGYKNFYKDVTSETTAQVIIALTSLGIDPQTDSRFSKEGNPVSALLSMQLDSGAFSHTKGADANEIATYQSLCALVSYYRFLSGEKSFYSFGRYEYKEKTQKPNINTETKKKTQIKNKSTTSYNSNTENKTAEKSEQATEKSTTSSKTKSSQTPEKNVKKSKKKTKSGEIKADKTEETKPTPTNKKVKKKLLGKEETANANDNTVYIPFAVLFALYIILAIRFRGGKK